MRDRDERREYKADVFYEAWCRGYNPDKAVDCAYDCFDAGRSPKQCVDGYAQRVRDQQRREAAEEDEYGRY